MCCNYVLFFEMNGLNDEIIYFSYQFPWLVHIVEVIKWAASLSYILAFIKGKENIWPKQLFEENRKYLWWDEYSPNAILFDLLQNYLEN